MVHCWARLAALAHGCQHAAASCQSLHCSMLLSKKYGCANISFTHDPMSVIASSNKVGPCPPAELVGWEKQSYIEHWMQRGDQGFQLPRPSRFHTAATLHAHVCPLQGADYALRYHDLHANRFVRYFRGHTGRVTTLSMSPKSDVFLSAAEDKQVGSGCCWSALFQAAVHVADIGRVPVSGRGQAGGQRLLVRLCRLRLLHALAIAHNNQRPPIPPAPPGAALGPACQRLPGAAAGPRPPHHRIR